MRENNPSDELFRKASAGDQQALSELLSEFRKPLKRMVRLRLNRALQGRVDDSDIVQEAFLDAARRLDEFAASQTQPFFLWLRQITANKLIDVHRRHLGAKRRDARQDLSLHYGPTPFADSASLAAHLMGRTTSPSNAAIRAEMRMRVQEILETMDEVDREVLALRHFEQLSNTEAAQVLGINESTASTRYLRALKRLKLAFEGNAGFLD